MSGQPPMSVSRESTERPASVGCANRLELFAGKVTGELHTKTPLTVFLITAFRVPV